MVGPIKSKTTQPPVQPPPARPAETKPQSAAKTTVAHGSTPDRIDRSHANPAERQAIRDVARASSSRTDIETLRARRTQEPTSPAVQAALDANTKVTAAEGKVSAAAAEKFRSVLPSFLGGSNPTPEQKVVLDQRLEGAQQELAQAKTVAAQAGTKAVDEAKAPVQQAMADSATAQLAATTANSKADAAQANLTGLQRERTMMGRESPDLDLSGVDKQIRAARGEVTTANEQARTANAAALDAGDKAVHAQLKANSVAEKVGQPPPYPDTVGLKGTADAANLPVDQQRAVLGAPAGVSSQEARDITAERTKLAATTATQTSGEAQGAAQTAKANMDKAQADFSAALGVRNDLALQGAPQSEQLAAQKNVENTNAQLRAAQSTFNKADRAARSTGDAAIQAQQQANQASTSAGRLPPFPDAVGLKDTVDAASLGWGAQQRVLGGSTTVSPQEAATADAQRVNTGTPEQRATALANQLEASHDPAYKSALVAAAAPSVEALAASATQTGGASANRVADEMARAMKAAGPDGDKLAAAYSDGVKGATHPNSTDVTNILAENDPATRNTQITQGYHDLSNQVGDLLGKDNANWLTFGQHASYGAGQGIRGELPSGPLGGTFDGLAGADKEKTQRALGEGNKAIFNDIAPHFQDFNETFRADPRWRNDPAHGKQMLENFKTGVPSELRPAFEHYYDAMQLNAGPHNARTDEQRAQAMLRANTEVAAYEQQVADKYIRDAVPEGSGVGNVGSTIFTGSSVAEQATDRITLAVGQAQVNVSRDMDREPPSQLKDLQDPDGYWKKRAQEWTNTDNINDRGNSDANNWRDYNERMGFIVHFFRGYQQDANVWAPPPGVTP